MLQNSEVIGQYLIKIVVDKKIEEFNNSKF